MSEVDNSVVPAEGSSASPRLAVLLAMAMFVLVVDTSLMNVSISAVVARPGHHRERRAVGDRARGAGLGGVHPDQQQGRRSHRAQAGIRTGSPGLCDRRPGNDARAGPDRDHRLLGDHRRARGVAAAAGDAVADPRQLRRRGPHAGVRAGRRVRSDRRGGGPAAGRLCDHVPVMAGRLPARGRRHRGRALADQARPRRGLHGASRRSTSSVRSSRSSGWAGSFSASSSGRREAPTSA